MTEALENLYRFITRASAGEDREEACAGISEQACENAPQSFFLNAINGTLTKLADQLASPGLVLPWFLDAIAAPTALIGLVTPIRRAGALLFQLVISGNIRPYKIRKVFWMAGGGIFGLCILLMIPTALLFEPLPAAIGVLVLLGLGSLGRGLSSVAFKDVLAKTIPRGRRGTLLSVRATVGGGLALIAGLIIQARYSQPDQESLTTYLAMLGIAGGLWVVSTLPVWLIGEPQGQEDERRNIVEEVRAGYRILKKLPGFRRFVVNRGMLLSIELSLPYFALYARRATDGGFGTLGSFVIAASFSSVLSSPFWGRFADRSSRFTMVASAALAGAAGIYVLLVDQAAALPATTLSLAVPVVLIGFAVAGARLGRKTYLVDSAPETQRPLFVAVSNTISGGLILLGGGLGVVAERFGLIALIGLLTAFAGGAILTGWWLPEAEHGFPIVEK